MRRASLSKLSPKVDRALAALALTAACAGAPRAVPVEPAPPAAPASAPPKLEDALPPGWSAYEEPGRLRVGYPPETRLTPGAELGVGRFGKPLVRLALPESEAPAEKTNFAEAALLLSVAEGPRDLAACTTFSDLERESEFRDAKSVKGVEFAARSFVESSAESRTESRVYRTLRPKGCYEVALSVRTTSLDAAPAGSVEAFDVEQAFGPLERVFETLRFSE